MKKVKVKAKKTFEDELLDLYLKIKVRKNEDIDGLDDKALAVEKEKLKGTDNLTLLNYIKSSIDILIKLKAEELFEEVYFDGDKEKETGKKGKSSKYSKKDVSNPNEPINEYEAMLIKAEADIRLHLKTEHQLKLHADNVQGKLDEVERSLADFKKKYSVLEKELNHNKIKEITEIKELEIQKLKLELNQIKPLMKSYEEQNVKITELEKKISVLTEQERELKDKIKRQNEQIKMLEDVRRTNQTCNLNLDCEYIPSNSSSRGGSNAGNSGVGYGNQGGSQTERINHHTQLNDKEHIKSQINFYRMSMEKKHQEISGLKMLVDDLKIKLNQANHSGIRSDHSPDLELDSVLERGKSKDKVNLNNISKISIGSKEVNNQSSTTSNGIGAATGTNIISISGSNRQAGSTLNPETALIQNNNPFERANSNQIPAETTNKHRRTNSDFMSNNNHSLNILKPSGNYNSGVNGIQVRNTSNLGSTGTYSSNNFNTNLSNGDSSKNGSLSNRAIIPQPKKTKYIIDKKSNNLVPVSSSTLSNTMLNFKQPQQPKNESNSTSGLHSSNLPAATNSFKTNDLNLRQYIINKITNKRHASKDFRNSSLSKDYTNNSKSASMINYN